MTSKEYGAQLLAKWRAEGKRQKGLKSMQKPSAQGGRYRVHLPGGISMIGLGDYGADNSALSAKLVDRMKSKGISLTIMEI